MGKSRILVISIITSIKIFRSLLELIYIKVSVYINIGYKSLSFNLSNTCQLQLHKFTKKYLFFLEKMRVNYQ